VSSSNSSMIAARREDMVECVVCGCKERGWATWFESRFQCNLDGLSLANTPAAMLVS